MNEKSTAERTPPHSAAYGSVADNLANTLRDAIAAGDFVVGGSLPSERDLMARFGVSRTSVREALRVLGAQGLIEVRRGRKGGSYVSNPRPEILIQSLNMFIKGQDIRFIDLVFAREAIEPAAAAQAALFRTDAQLADLRRQCDRCDAALDDIGAFTVANLDWHLAVVAASNNPLFRTFVSSIATALHTATEREEFDFETRREVAKVHRRIVSAIVDRDPDAARRRMQRHLTAYREELSAMDLVNGPAPQDRGVAS